MLKKFIDKYNNFPVQMKASFWFIISATFQRGFSVITAPIFTRLLSTAEYGDYNVFNSWLSIISIIVTFNLFYGVYMQGLVKYEDDRKVFVSSMQGLTTILTAAWFVIYIIFHNFWNNLFSLTTPQMLLMFSSIWILGVYNFWSGEQRVEFKYKKLVLLTIIGTIIKPVLSIILIFIMDDNVTARIAGSVIIDILMYTYFFFSQMKRGKKWYSKKYWKHGLKFNLPLVPHYLSQIVLSSADRIMIKNMVGASEAGIYSLAYSVSMIMSMFNTALMQTIEPWLYKKIKQGETDDIKTIAYPSFVMVAIINILLIAFAPEVVKIFAPAEYMDAIGLIPPVAMSVYFIYIYSFFATFEFYFEKTHYITIATITGAVFNLVTNYIFINMFGYYAASYTTLVCYILFAILHYFFMKKICKKNLPGKKIYDEKIILLITIIFLIVGFAFSFTYEFTLLRYLLIAVICLIVFLKRDVFIKILKVKKKED